MRCAHSRDLAYGALGPSWPLSSCALTAPRTILRTLRYTLTGAVGLAAVLAGEVLLAQRAERLEPFARDELDGVYGEGSQRTVKLVWIGDSTSVGVGSSRPASTLPVIVARGLERPVRLSVFGESGAKTIDALREQLPLVRDLEPDWVIIGIGNNDVSKVTPRARFREQLGQLVQGVREAGPSRIALLGVAEWSSTPLLWQPLRFVAGKRSDMLDADVRRVAAEQDVLYVDIKGRTGAHFVEDPKRFHARDGFHPSDLGYEAWARVTLEAMEQAGW